MIVFALMEPEEGDAHTVFVDGLLMSSGSESYRQPAVPRQPNVGSQCGRPSAGGTIVGFAVPARCCAADGE
jgi:hypothetical protein